MTLAVLAATTPASATAAPSFEIEHRALTPMTQLPARVATRLTITGTAQEERFRIQSARPLQIGGAIRVAGASVVGPAVAACPGTWQRFHAARLSTGTFNYDVVLAPGGTAVADGTDVLSRAPWRGEDEMGLAFRILPEFTGAPTTLSSSLTIASDAPLYQGPLGVQIRLSTASGRIVGMTTPVVNSGRVVLRARPAGSTRSIPVATLPVRDGAFTTRWRAPRGGRWEVYAQYRTASPSNYANDASECGLPVVALR